MSNGLWSGTQAGEKIQQSDIIRHRTLIVCCGQNIAIPWPNEAASGFASADPNSIAPGTHNTLADRGVEGGPHFVMSGETTDESHTYGFEFCLSVRGLGAPALSAGGTGYDVTIWVLIANSEDPGGVNTPVWAAFATNTGVHVNEMWHSFDVNAEAIRFQFGNLADDPLVNNEDIIIMFAEL